MDKLDEDDLGLINLDLDDPKKKVYKGKDLHKDFQDKLIQFLTYCIYCYTWSNTDMVGVDPYIITHKLNVAPAYLPVQQKWRRMALRGIKL